MSAGPVRIELKDDEILARLRELAARLSDTRPLMTAIGRDLTESTRLRFRDARGPDGGTWQPLAQATMVLRLMRNKGNFRRNGRGAKFRGKMRFGLASLTERGRTEASKGFAPLLDTGTLRNSITYKLMGHTGVVIGTNWGAGSIKHGAAIHQFGGMAGRGRKVKIPARPFLGVSADDRSQILDRIAEFVAAKP